MPIPFPPRLRPPPGLARLPISLVALGLALAGQVGLGNRSLPWLGALLLVGGGLLLAVAAWRAGPAPSPASLAKDHPASPDASDSASTSPSESDDPADSDAASSRDSLVGGRIGLGALLLVTLAAAAFRLPWITQLPPGSPPTRPGSAWTPSTC